MVGKAELALLCSPIGSCQAATQCIPNTAFSRNRSVPSHGREGLGKMIQRIRTIRRRPPEKELSRRTALIVGGGSGIGREVALLAAERGAHIMVANRDFAGAAKVAEEVKAIAGMEAVSWTNIDIRDRKAIKAALEATIKQFAQLFRNGMSLPDGPSHAPRNAALIFHSLAARYAAILNDLTNLTYKRFHRLFIVGGGSRNTYLNHLIEITTGAKVIPASTESLTIGNFAIQLAASEQWSVETGVPGDSVARWASILNNSTVTA